VKQRRGAGDGELVIVMEGLKEKRSVVEIGHNENNDRIFNFVTTRGTFSYNEMTGEFNSKLQIR
jgi:hypothetical protein